MTDDRLEELARKLGSRAADRIDVEATARTVLERLKAGEQPQRASWIRPAWLRIAATVVVLLGGATLVQRITRSDPALDHSAHFVADDLRDLSSDQLQDVLSRFDEFVGSTTLPDSADLRELNAQQLRQMLRSLEG